MHLHARLPEFELNYKVIYSGGQAFRLEKTISELHFIDILSI